MTAAPFIDSGKPALLDKVSIDMKTALVALSALQSTACRHHLNDQLDGKPGFNGCRPPDTQASHHKFVMAHNAIADAIEGSDSERMFGLGCSSDATPESIDRGMRLAQFLVPYWLEDNTNHEGRIPPAASQTMARVIYELTFLSATTARSVLAIAAKAHGLELMSICDWTQPNLSSSVAHD
jgi:hypothetical protein